MGDSGEWGADTQDRHHGVPELEGGRGAFCDAASRGEGTVFGPFLDRFWVVLRPDFSSNSQSSVEFWVIWGGFGAG